MGDNGGIDKEDKDIGNRQKFVAKKEPKTRVLNEVEVLKVEMIKLKNEKLALETENIKLRQVLLRYESMKTFDELGFGDGAWNFRTENGKVIAIRKEG